MRAASRIAAMPCASTVARTAAREAERCVGRGGSPSGRGTSRAFVTVFGLCARVLSWSRSSRRGWRSERTVGFSAEVRSSLPVKPSVERPLLGQRVELRSEQRERRRTSRPGRAIGPVLVHRFTSGRAWWPSRSAMAVVDPRLGRSAGWTRRPVALLPGSRPSHGEDTSLAFGDGALR